MGDKAQDGPWQVDAAATEEGTVLDFVSLGMFIIGR
jgi:hypothetical protein